MSKNLRSITSGGEVYLCKSDLLQLLLVLKKFEKDLETKVVVQGIIDKLTTLEK
tara:strand:- start:8771 stop:8932 length:162 start_codon:yes stop_codon:yes gene_type:complete